MQTNLVLKLLAWLGSIAIGFGICWLIYGALDFPGESPRLFWISFSIITLLMIWQVLSEGLNGLESGHKFKALIQNARILLTLAAAFFVAASLIAALVVLLAVSGSDRDCPAGAPARYC